MLVIQKWLKKLIEKINGHLLNLFNKILAKKVPKKLLKFERFESTKGEKFQLQKSFVY